MATFPVFFSPTCPPQKDGIPAFLSFVPALHSGSLACTPYFATRIKVFSGRGLGRRLFQKGGLPSVPSASLYPAQ